jgi:hypothetical protein
MGYFISLLGLELEIKLEEIRKLYVHEETIPRIVEWLSGEIKRGIYRHPVIVDKENLVVLDGMHRVAALRHLGYKLVPVCLVNYSNQSIKVKNWFRTIENGQKLGENLRKDLEESGYNLKEIAHSELMRKMCNRQVILGIATAGKCYGIPGKNESIKRISEYIKQLERTLKSFGYGIGYETESDAEKKIKASKALAIIILPRITKRDVVTTALSGKLFVHKLTRHVIPIRPFSVNVPTKWLNMDPKEANRLLTEHLSKKKLKHLPHVKNRDHKYEEEHYFFSDP